MGMVGDRYVVKKGDSLWKIAGQKLGGGKQWPRIWKYNNRAEVIAETGRGIPNPDLIYVGQVLLIPRVPGSAVVPSTAADPGRPALPAATEPTKGTEPTSKTPSKTTTTPKTASAPQTTATPPQQPSNGSSQHVAPIASPVAFKFRLESQLPPQDLGTAILEVRMTGDVLLMTKKSYPVIYLTNRGEIELQTTKEANHAFGKLIGDNRFIYDPKEKRVTMRSMLVSQSSQPNTVATALGVEISSNSPIPKLRAEIRLPKLEGSIDVFNYVALDVKIVIEITPKLLPPPTPRLQPQRIQNPVEKPNWDAVIGAGLVTVAGVIVVATVVEDFMTLGAGLADDPPSFAAAGAAFVKGLRLISGPVAAGLPAAAAAAEVDVNSTVTLPEK